MNKHNNLPIKEPKKLRLCGYCLKIKGRSANFQKPYSLTWHITHEHRDDIGIIEPAMVPQSETLTREIE